MSLLERVWHEIWPIVCGGFIGGIVALAVGWAIISGAQ